MSEKGGEKGCEEDVLFHVVCVSYDKISVIGEDSINLLNDKGWLNKILFILQYWFMLSNKKYHYLLKTNSL